MQANLDDRKLYAGRRLTEGYPGLERLGMSLRDRDDRRDEADQRDVAKSMRYLGRLIDLDGPRNFAVIGCGHRPKILRVLREMGHRGVGVEPVPSYVDAANAYLGNDEAVLKGTAEDIPLADGLQHVVWFENVLEHVDSVARSLSEIHRVTAPGGIAYVKTNSRYFFSPVGTLQRVSGALLQLVPGVGQGILCPPPAALQATPRELLHASGGPLVRLRETL